MPTHHVRLPDPWASTIHEQEASEPELVPPAMHPDLDGLLLQLAARPTSPDAQVVIERELARLANQEPT